MTDTQNGQNQGQGSAPAAMPTANKPAEVIAPPAPEARPAEGQGEIPKEVSERTRQEFEKLKAKNQELAKKLEAFEKPTAPRSSAFDLFVPQESSVPVPTPVPQMFGPQTPKAQAEAIPQIAPDENGYVDLSQVNQTVARVNEAIKQIEEKAKTADERSRKAVDKVSKYEHTDKTLKTYAVHPYLDPNGKQFDEKFSELVKRELLFRMYSGGSQDYLDAANTVKDNYYDPSKKTPIVDTKRQETVAQRDQITPPQGGGYAPPPVDENYLVEGTRRGDAIAINERLKRSGY